MSDGADIFSKIPELGYSETAPPTDVKAFDAILAARRSVRVYGPEPVPAEVIRHALSAALLAPNSSNLQCWEFQWVKSLEKKRLLAKFCFNQPAARTAQELIVCIARPQKWREHAQQMLQHFDQSKTPVPKSARAYYAKLAPFVYTQGFLGTLGFLKKILFFIRGLTQITPREPTSWSEMRIWANKSCALACQNFMLGISAQGFDTCPMEGFDSKRVKKLLSLGCKDDIVMVISVGRRAPNGVYGPRLRFPEAQFIKEV
ncbi:MAG: nitroreductase family protein [Bacteriovoracia bacterium]